MLIRALCDYADKQAASEKKLPECFGEQDIHYRIILSEDGSLKQIIPFMMKRTIKDKRARTRSSRCWDPPFARLTGNSSRAGALRTKLRTLSSRSWGRATKGHISDLP